MTSKVQVIIINRRSLRISSFSSIHKACIWMLGRSMKDHAIFLRAPDGLSIDITELKSQLTTISKFGVSPVRPSSSPQHPNDQCEPDCITCSEVSQNGQ